MSSTCVCPTCRTTVPAANDRARAAALCKGKHVTPRQLDVLEYILMYRRRVGMSPTLADIGAELGTSRVTALGHTSELVRKGLLTASHGRARAFVPVENGKGK